MSNIPKISIISKTAARLIVVQSVYATLSNQQTFACLKENFDKLMGTKDEQELTNSIIDKRFAKKLIANLELYSIEIENKLKAHLRSQDNFGLKLTATAIIKTAIAEILFQNTPKNVIISEYVGLAEDISTEGEVKLINALLSDIINSQ